jgi:predicted CopG family antitoxin
MAANVLTEEQRITLIEWLAAGYPEPLIQQMFAARGWKQVSRQAVDHHREQHREAIEQRRREREAAAYDAGLAQRDVRVRFLVKHAEALAEVAWTPDDKGKLHNEKALRECLDDIAREMGHRRQGIDLAQTFGKMSDEELDEYIAAAQLAGTPASEGGEGSAAAADGAEIGRPQ